MRYLNYAVSAAVLVVVGCVGGDEGAVWAGSPSSGAGGVGGAAGAAAGVARDGATLRIHVLEVDAPAGGGDAILVADSTVSPPRHVLIDAGDDGAAARALTALGVPSLDLMVLTHAHHDHYGGMDDVLDAVPVGAFAFGGQVRTAVTYRRLLERVRDEVARIIVVDSLRTVRLDAGDSATTLVLVPPLARYLSTDTDDGERINEGSLAVRIERGGFSFLSTGDAEDEANRRFARRFRDEVDVDVLKVGHHGSTDATQAFWLEATTPVVAVVSANGTTHPHAPVLAMLRERGVRLYCTPQHGRITIVVRSGGPPVVRTDRPADVPCRRGRER